MLFEVIGKDNCQFCSMAVDFLSNKKLPFIYKKVGTAITYDEILQDFPGVKTVPIISVDGKFLGGYRELVKFIESTVSADGW